MFIPLCGKCGDACLENIIHCLNCGEYYHKECMENPEYCPKCGKTKNLKWKLYF